MKKFIILSTLFVFLFSLLTVRCFADSYFVSNQEELSNFISISKDGDVVEIVNPGNYTLPSIPNNITLKANCDDVFINASVSLTICSALNGVTFENLNFIFGQDGYRGFQHSGKIIMKNCVLNDLFFSYSDMEFYNCTFNQSSSDNYCMWCYIGNITYDNCTFNVKGKALNLYNETYPGYPWIIKVKDCTFNSDRINKSALNIKEFCSYGKLYYTVLIDNCTTNDNFPVDKLGNSKLWMVDDFTPDKISRLLVFYDGEKVYPFDSTDFIYDGYQSINDNPQIDVSIEETEWANKICNSLSDTNIDLLFLAKKMSVDSSIVDDAIKKKVVSADSMIDLYVYYNNETKILVETTLKQKLYDFSIKNNKLKSYSVDISPEYIIKAFNIDDDSKYVILSDDYHAMNITDSLKVKMFLPEGFVEKNKTKVYIKHNDIIYGDENDALNGDIYILKLKTEGGILNLKIMMDFQNSKLLLLTLIKKMMILIFLHMILV